MKFTFIGNGNDDPKNIKLYGYSFALNGDAVEVVEEWIQKKLSGGHFEYDDSGNNQDKNAEDLKRIADYTSLFGKPPRKNMTAETMKKAIEEGLC